MLILGIETSCDDTSIAVLRVMDDEVEVLSNVISSQIQVHAPYGGVVPVLAAREHTKNFSPVLRAALKKAKSKMSDIDLIAVTSGPGLIPALLTGVAFAKTLAWRFNKPLMGTNHMEGHIMSNWLESRELALNSKKAFPALCLVVSGGHTQLVLMGGLGRYKLIGETLDDAAGEAFDKIARTLGLGYPGGPAIAAQAEKKITKKIGISLPRPMAKNKGYDFSFSGLKTAVLYKVRDLTKHRSLASFRTEIAHEAQEAIVDSLIIKTKRAARDFKAKSLMLAGGVAANKRLRQRLIELGTVLDIPVFVPQMQYTTDNAAMIAMAAAANLGSKKPNIRTHNWKKVKADANWEIV